MSDSISRELRVQAAREAILGAFHDTPASAWYGKLNSSISIPPGMNMGPYFDRMAEAVVDALVGGFNIVRSDTVVQTFDDGDAKITIYEAVYKTGTVFVAADQAGWLDGSWATPDEALQAALRASDLT